MNLEHCGDYSLSLEKSQGMAYFISRALLEENEILVVFSGRSGGHSKGDFSSLNLALHVGDDSADVLKNRERFFSLFGLDYKQAVCAEQVHGTKVATVGRSDAGKGATFFETSVGGVDGLVTNYRRLPLALFFADCVPLIIVDRKNRSIGVSHAGWRGIYGYIVSNTVSALSAMQPTGKSNLLAFIGPSIGSCCYQVGAELIERFAGRFSKYDNWLIKDRVDLRAIAAAQLIESGLRADNIYTCDTCTACDNQDFFSYRADKGSTGRHSAIGVIL